MPSKDYVARMLALTVIRVATDEYEFQDKHTMIVLGRAEYEQLDKPKTVNVIVRGIRDE